MDKTSATARLDAIEREAKELRKIIESPEKLVYDQRKLYVGIDQTGCVGLLTARPNGRDWRFHSFEPYHAAMVGWGDSDSSAEACIDGFIKNGGTVKEFKPLEGLKYFISHYKGE